MKTWEEKVEEKKGLVKLIDRFHDMAEEEKNLTMKRYYWKHFNHLFKLWFPSIDLILDR